MTIIPALFASDLSRIWFLIPLALAISFAYTASRYESREVIIRRSANFFWKTLAFMALIFVVLYLLALGL